MNIKILSVKKIKKQAGYSLVKFLVNGVEQEDIVNMDKTKCYALENKNTFRVLFRKSIIGFINMEKNKLTKSKGDLK